MSRIREVTFNFLCFISNVAIIIESERLAAPSESCSSRFLSAPTSRILITSESLTVSYSDISTLFNALSLSWFTNDNMPSALYFATAAMLPSAILRIIPITRNTLPTFLFFPFLFFTFSAIVSSGFLLYQKH